MQASASSHEDNRRQSQAIPEFDILWITAGLGCDGDTIAMTAATQPSIEEILLGGIPWIPKVRLHNPFLTYDNGAEIAFLSKVLEEKLCEESVPESGDAAKIVFLVNDAIRKTKELARGLLPVVSEAQGLMAALKQCAEETEDLFRVIVALNGQVHGSAASADSTGGL
jgi:hypothetical protein